MGKTTHKYTIDTESQVINKVAKGALVQIQFIHSIQESTLVLIEMFYLPNQDSLLFKKIKELCSIILRDENKKITWGPFDNEFKNFHSYELFEKGKIKNTINLQDRFSDWYNKPPSNTPPAKESREEQTTWSLQDAVKIAFQQFLDKNETVNKWRCGLDFKLNTWKKKLFSKNHYNANEEKEKRTLMIKYAVADCTAVTKLYFMIYPSDSSIQTSYETPTPTTASTNIILNIDDLSDISEEEEEPEILMPRFDKEPKILMPQFDKQPQILMPYFNKPPQILIQKFDEQNYLTIETTEEEMNEFNVQEQQQQETTTKTKLSKSEKQRKKNLKLKWKQKHHNDGLIALQDYDNDDLVVIHTKRMVIEEKLRQENRQLLEINRRLEQQKDESNQYQLQLEQQLRDLRLTTEKYQISMQGQINAYTKQASQQENQIHALKTSNSLLCRSNEIWCLPMTNVEFIIDNSPLSNHQSLCFIIIVKEQHKIKLIINQYDSLNQCPDV
ncbi:unnamed protein product [Rotaria sordida]|uniref:Uncharacterized protein n=1 Tax=Rotaria sordida TaxID=392033 RepID=A0A820AS88_9BILA|nr:unnamed protein product [Rotaria sordida]